MNHSAKFDVASCILAGKICNRTKKTKLQNVNDISTPCLSARVDNNCTFTSLLTCTTLFNMW